MDGSIFDEQCRRNRTTVERWEVMASHRARVMELLQEARKGSGASLCLLGAGNGNDIDLPRLTTCFPRIALIDLDQEALDRAVRRVPASALCRVEQHGGIDLTGILPTLSRWNRGSVPSDAELTATIEAARSAPPPGAGTFDVVGSTCVLTQLIDSIYLGLPSDHPRGVELVLAVRNRHLEMMVELLNPGGMGVLVTDFVSTETAPELANLEDLRLADAAVQWINQRNFFTGANPWAIRDFFRNLAAAHRTVEDIRVTAPWRWDIGAKQFAVAAVTIRRSRE